MINVSASKFYTFIMDNQLREVPGNWMHSFNYLNDKNEIKAYMCFSSWGTKTEYKIDIEGIEENQETLNLINKIINH